MSLLSLAEIEMRIDTVAAGNDVSLATAGQLVNLGEQVIAHWVTAHGGQPTTETREGSRLLALHRQGARGHPSFNACRETCRELVYHHNLIAEEPTHPDTAKRLMFAGLVAKHLCLFVSGKLQEAQLGEFCCSSRPVRAHEA